MEKANIFWFRRDLRLDDNHGLYQALKSDKKIIPIFIFDKEILKHLDNKDDPRVSFIHSNLLDIKIKLQEFGSDLKVFYGDVFETWETLIQEIEIDAVFCNSDYEPRARKRDDKVAKFLKGKNIGFFQYKDQCIFDTNDILKKDMTPYTVYTPYKRKWLELFSPKDLLPYKTKALLKNFKLISPTKMIELEEMGFTKTGLSLPKKIISKKILEQYHQDRDIPSIDGTSKLGLHLRFGTISPRKCALRAFELSEVWLSELIWREFFMQILFHFPHVTKKSFREKYDKIPWLNNKADFKKWCTGTTGYPMVDAGMRELNQTGHMHNRVRMVVASFLVKHLLIDWRWGERYFAQKLLDYDLASNNGNWQWAAGTGCDAAPYFRVFNPTLQLQRFDPKLIYIKKWIPEYNTDEYPEKMVDHKFASQRAIVTYKESIN